MHDQSEISLLAAAGAGTLREFIAQEPESGNAVLYRIVSDLVYERVTRPIERRRGHWSCLASVYHLEPECHDRHQDDVLAVRAFAVRHSDRPIANLPGWLASRLKPICVDAHRARRGDRGALQRPRLPRWLIEELGSDEWLCWLAMGVLTWVGVLAAVPGGLWPLEAWAQYRTQTTGFPCSEWAVARDVERVCAAIRARPDYYERYVELPLGRKSAPVVTPRCAERGAELELRPLALAASGQSAEVWLHEAAVRVRVAADEELRSACISVLSEVFESGTGGEEMDCVPGAAPDVTAALELRLAGPATVDRIVDALFGLLESAEPTAPVRVSDRLSASYR